MPKRCAEDVVDERRRNVTCTNCNFHHKKCTGADFEAGKRCDFCVKKGFLSCKLYVAKKSGPKPVDCKKQKICNSDNIDLTPELGIMGNIAAALKSAGAAAGAAAAILANGFHNFHQKGMYSMRRQMLMTMWGAEPLTKAQVKDVGKKIPKDKIGFIVDATRPYSERFVFANKMVFELFGNIANLKFENRIIDDIAAHVGLQTNFRVPKDGIHLPGPYLLELENTMGTTYVMKNIHIFGTYHIGVPSIEDSNRAFVCWADEIEGPNMYVTPSDELRDAIVRNFMIQTVNVLARKEQYLDEFMEKVPLNEGDEYEVHDMAASRFDPGRGILRQNHQLDWHNDPIDPVSTVVDSDTRPIHVLIKFLVGNWTYKQGWKAPNVKVVRQDGTGDHFHLKNVRVYFPDKKSKLYNLNCKVMCIVHDKIEVQPGPGRTQAEESQAEESQAEESQATQVSRVV